MKKLCYVMLAGLFVFTGCVSNKIGAEKVPEWVLHEPESTNSIIYGVGYGNSADANMALKMAKADAHNNLSKKLNLVINDKVQTTTTGGDSTSNLYVEKSEQSSESVLKNASLKEYYERKDGSNWTVYVLLEMSVTSANISLPVVVTSTPAAVSNEE